LPYLGGVWVRGYVVLGLAAVAVAGCSDDDEQRTMATKPASTGATPSDQATAPAEPAQRRPVRLLLLGRFDEPTYVAAPRGDKRRFVVEREGRIRVVQGGRVLGTPFLDIADRVTTGGESGLLSMAFAGDYSQSRRFWVYYTDNQGFLQIDQFRASASNRNRADPGSRRSVIRVPHHRSNHKGGQLQVAPDGTLLAGFGDGGAGGDPDENAQNLSRMLGKLIRIRPNPNGGYAIPADNPFRNRPGARPEIYAYGLRNPYRFSFDRRRGDLTIGDVGQDEIEEIDFVRGRSGGRAPRGGDNFGWDTFEGRSRYESGTAPGHVPPVLQHTHGQGFCSITGGYVIRDRSLGRGWYGRYVYGDYCDGTLRLSHLRRPSASTRATRLSVSNLVSFGEDSRGRVYAVSLDGPVFRIGRR
jgi:glucose/arabinose dehydrogenase